MSKELLKIVMQIVNHGDIKMMYIQPLIMIELGTKLEVLEWEI